METKCLYIRTRGETDSQKFVEIEIVDSCPDEITILVPDKTLGKRRHTELYHQTSEGTFVRQMFRVLRWKRHRQGILLYLSQVSTSKPAEMRKHPRIAVVGIYARFGDEERCAVVDISERGLCVVSSGHAAIGASVRVVLEFDGTSYTGAVRVTNARELEPGSNRYGTVCIGSMVDPDELSKALPRITMQIQLLAADPVAD